MFDNDLNLTRSLYSKIIYTFRLNTMFISIMNDLPSFKNVNMSLFQRFLVNLCILLG